MLDTDILIDFQRKYPPAAEWFASLPEIPHVAGLVAMELLQDARNRDELKRSLKLLATLQPIWPTESECSQALFLFSKYHLSHNLGLIDAFLAAIALSHDADLCTFNVKHYRGVPGLSLRKPYAKR